MAAVSGEALRAAVRRFASATRSARWGILAAIAALVIYLSLFQWQHSPTSDGYYTWIFARSLVYDHDFDFTNDYAICGDPHHRGVLRGTSHPDNPFYIGPAVIWAPLLWVLRAAHHMSASEPEAIRLACRGPLAIETTMVAPFLGAFTVWMLYRIGRRHAGDGVAGLSAGLLGMGTPLLANAAISVSYSHVYDAFWAAIAILAAVRASERPSLARWSLAGIAVGVNLLQRPVSALYGVVPLALAIAGAPAPRLRSLLAPSLALAFGVVLFGVIPQALVYKYLYGHYWVGAPHGHFYMQYGHAHPWLLLFAPHGGLFFHSPVVWLAVPGVVIGLRHAPTRVLMASLLVAAAATVWLSSAALDWDASWTIGARRLTSLVALLAAPMAIALSKIERWLRARPARAATALALASCSAVAIAGAGTTSAVASGVVPGEAGASQADLYGGGARVVGGWVDRFGDLAVLPAELMFHLRYGLPMNAFRAAAEPTYDRNYRTMDRPDKDLDLRAHLAQLTGLEKRGDDLVMTGTRATFVFTATWPFATHVIVKARATPDNQLRVGRRMLTGTVWYGAASFGPDVQVEKYAVPASGFDSGLLELVFERAETGGTVAIQSIRIEDSAQYGPPL
jgi:hypothetical protein